MVGDRRNSVLGIYRVLDLTDEKGMICGEILAQLGADVIKIEKPGGDLARNIGPFYEDTPHPEKSLFWFAYNANKRSITLNIETSDGQQIFRRLLKTADIVLESFPPGYLDELGLGYPDLSGVNRKIIMTSITPFGQSGPYQKYKGSDVVVWAMGGIMSLCGDSDAPPVQVSFPQSYIAASTYAVEATLIALYARNFTGEGQRVDVSAQATIAWFIAEKIPFWVLLGENIRRYPGMTRSGGLKIPGVFPCKDGYVAYLTQLGQAGAERNIRLTEWLEEEGFATEHLKSINWHKCSFEGMTQEDVESLLEPVRRLFIAHTVSEIYSEAVKRVIAIYPVASSKNTLENPQLATRGFWVNLEHPELGVDITYPGVPIVFSETPMKLTHRAPLVGEHNEEIYIGEFRLSKDELIMLKGSGAI